MKKVKVKLSPREARLKRLYGLEPGDYEKILEYQNGLCFICKRLPKEGKNLHVDHNHKTGQTRGLLCWQDNGALAKFKEDTCRLHNAEEYLTHPPATQALGREVFGRTGRITNKRKRKKRKTKKVK
jgi:hypothetical protein